MTARVSVVVPVHSQAAFLPRALGSLLDSSVPDWEAVVLDDGSFDDTAPVVEEVLRASGDPRLRSTGWPANRGLGATLNAGLDLTSAPLVAYLPADDAWDRDHLAALIDVLDDPDLDLAWSGVRRGGTSSLAAPDGAGLQLVQVAHRRTSGARWVERAELESDDLERLLLGRFPRRRGTGRVTCEWTDHPGQRTKAIRESFDGGLNVFRSRYRVREPLRFASSDSGEVDEVARYARFRDRAHPPAPDGLRVLLAGELAFNPERVLALAARGHELHGTWTTDGLGDMTVGPLPFGHVRDLPREGSGALQTTAGAVRTLAPDVVHAQLNWRAVRMAHALRRAVPEVPFVWHLKESPQLSVRRGEWPLLAELVADSDACLVATQEEREWLLLALRGRADPERLGVVDGDLPLAEWFAAAPRSPKLSAGDGEPHTVVLGRPLGLDLDTVLRLARARVHVHLHGQVAAPGPKGSWRAWLAQAQREAPRYVHVHPSTGPERWVEVLSAYDAGWLHRLPSDNGGDLRRASWDDLNAPARLPVLLGAGLAVLQPAHRGSRVAATRLLQECGAGLLYDDLDDLVDRLRAEVADPAAGRAAGRARSAWTYDAQVERVEATYRAAISRATPGRRGASWPRGRTAG